MTDINLELPHRLKPHLRLDSQTGEVVARLDEPTLQVVRQIIREELRRQEGFIHVVVQEELESYHNAYGTHQERGVESI